jgi:hypothetical protein
MILFKLNIVDKKRGWATQLPTPSLFCVNFFDLLVRDPKRIARASAPNIRKVHLLGIGG